MNRKFCGRNPVPLLAGKSPCIPALLLLCLLVTTLEGCLAGKIVDSREAFYRNEISVAVANLEEIKDKEGKDQILALLEYGMALHVAGRYQESADVLTQAAAEIDKTDVFKVGEKAGGLVTNKMVTTFRPESFERVLLHTYTAMNFIMLDDWQSARVEARKAIERLDEESSDLAEKQAFTHYVCGLTFDVMGERNSASIEYKKVQEQHPDFLPLYYDLYRLASFRGSPEEAAKWAEEMKQRDLEPSSSPSRANLVILTSAGRSPIKKEINLFVPPHNRFVVPDYESSNSLAHHATVRVENENTGKSYELTDLDPIAMEALKKRIAKEIAGETARVATKEIIAKQLEDQNPLLGFVARIIFFLTEAADTRSWEMLPRYLGVAAMELPPGSYNIQVIFKTKEGLPVETKVFTEVEVQENRRRVMSVRSVR